MIKEKRHNYVMKDFIVPIFTSCVVAIIIGAFGVVMAFKYKEGGDVEWRKGVERQISSLQVVLTAVQVNQVGIATQGQWMISTDSRLAKIESSVESIAKNVYSKSEMDKQHGQIIREIKLRHGEKP
tara:strand:- start:95 stop:472 length:378 start_codon:yes stop_codon:yes gene_type:complete